MEKLRHRKGYYKGCYHDVDEKSWMCGETLTLKEILDGWWNSVRIRRADGSVMMCYKNAYTCDPAYEDPATGELKGSILKKLVQLDDGWDEDADGYPIIGGVFVE